MKTRIYPINPWLLQPPLWCAISAQVTLAALGIWHYSNIAGFAALAIGLAAAVNSWRSKIVQESVEIRIIHVE